jgi:hypothetical protein
MGFMVKRESKQAFGDWKDSLLICEKRLFGFNFTPTENRNQILLYSTCFVTIFRIGILENYL